MPRRHSIYCSRAFVPRVGQRRWRRYTIPSMRCQVHLSLRTNNNSMGLLPRTPYGCLACVGGEMPVLQSVGHPTCLDGVILENMNGGGG